MRFEEVVAASDLSSGIVQLYVNMRGELLRFLTARLGDASAAEDAIQELWLRLSAAETGPIGNPRAYLYRAAQNVALDIVRARVRRTKRDTEWSTAIGGADLGGPSSQAETMMLAREETALLASAIAALPKAAGRAFRLHKLDGMSHADVAEHLGISRSGVEKHIAVAMAHLRRAMKD